MIIPPILRKLFEYSNPNIQCNLIEQNSKDMKNKNKQFNIQTQILQEHWYQKTGNSARKKLPAARILGGRASWHHFTARNLPPGTISLPGPSLLALPPCQDPASCHQRAARKALLANRAKNDVWIMFLFSHLVRYLQLLLSIKLANMITSKTHYWPSLTIIIWTNLSKGTNKNPSPLTECILLWLNCIQQTTARIEWWSISCDFRQTSHPIRTIWTSPNLPCKQTSSFKIIGMLN